MHHVFSFGQKRNLKATSQDVNENDKQNASYYTAKLLRSSILFHGSSVMFHE